MSDFLIVNVDSPKCSADMLSRVLETCGALSVTVTDSGDQPCFDIADPGEPDWDNQRLSGLFPVPDSLQTLLDKIQSNAGGEFKISVEKLHQADWERIGVSSFDPFKVGHKLWVCPTGCTPECPNDINMFIEPGMAFGTGTHETTHLCLDYLSRADLEGKSMLDIGCGSGILAIAGLKLGASFAVGVDIDPKALEVTATNAIINNVSDNLTLKSNLSFVQDSANQNFDVVVANILAQTLKEMSKMILSLVSSGGTVLLSGILESQIDEVKSAFDNDMKFTEYSNNDWVMLAGQAG